MWIGPSPLPPSLAPRGLGREIAAGYIGVGTTKFDQMVADGRMPPPKKIDGRKVWDRAEIDRAFEALPSESDDTIHENPWDGAQW